MLCHLYQSPMTTERWHTGRNSRTAWAFECVINLNITKICKSLSSPKGKIFPWMLFLAFGHDGSVPPTTMLSIAQIWCESVMEKRTKGKNTIFHFSKFLLKCQMPLTEITQKICLIFILWCKDFHSWSNAGERKEKGGFARKFVLSSGENCCGLQLTKYGRTKSEIQLKNGFSIAKAFERAALFAGVGGNEQAETH